STTIVDRNGRLLRAFATNDDRWRLPVKLEGVDKGLIDMLIAYEDKRFYRHWGVDPFAIMRAASQMIWNQKIVSGGSTLTMQVARLLDGHKNRSFRTKYLQIIRAFQLEWYLTKNQILTYYFNLAPYGGNLEGVRSASLAYFGKEPRRLANHERALLVALPQSPEARRPDRFQKRARKARNRILDRSFRAGILDADDTNRAKKTTAPGRRLSFPMHAAHLTQREKQKLPGGSTAQLTLDFQYQKSLEELVRQYIDKLGPRLSASLMVIDNSTGAIRAHIGSPGYLNESRFGAIDMTRAIRSPGSTLKPVIYGLAFDVGLAHPETLIEDRPTKFGDYVPENFDDRYRGTVTVRKALQLSLNVPAVKVLDALGPARLTGRLRQVGIEIKTPANLAVALGGIGITLHDLAHLYCAIANSGQLRELHHNSGLTLSNSLEPDLLSPLASWYIANILSGVPAPKNAHSNAISYKTGTSYGHRDAWAVGFDGQHTIAVWVGRPDNSSTPGITGVTSAAPLLFDAFGRIGMRKLNIASAPSSAIVATTATLPPTLRYFRNPLAGIRAQRPENMVSISY
ncbi:MAG: penicillin-binding protein 1C, partial [Desulfobulbia bacterium]